MSDGKPEFSPTPSPPPPAPERRFSPGEKALIAGLLAIIGMTLVVFAVMLKQYVAPKDPWQAGAAAKPQPSPYLQYDGMVFGSDDAKVKIVAVLPLSMPCHGETVEYLHRAVQAAPDKLQVKFVDYLKPAGKDEAKKYGCHCASIIINGQSRFKTETGKEFRFGGAFDEDYSLEDVRVYLGKQFAAAYGDGAPVLSATNYSLIALAPEAPAPSSAGAANAAEKRLPPPPAP